MVPIPLPSHIHYELLLQLLERQTAFAVEPSSPEREKIHELTTTIRKALAQQKQLEDSCRQSNLEIEYRWSLNEVRGEQIPAANVANYGQGNRPLA